MQILNSSGTLEHGVMKTLRVSGVVNSFPSLSNVSLLFQTTCICKMSDNSVDVWGVKAHGVTITFILLVRELDQQ